MCGIAIIQSNNTEKLDRIRDMLDPIVHRGTKHHEIKKLKGFSLGANRLPIQGRESGSQPISNEEKTVRAVLNGEIFNYSPLRLSLEELGHRFSTTCDTELLVHLYEEYGPNGINDKIDSEMFFYGIVDLLKERVVVAKDAFGTKPGYFGYGKEGSIYFVSEMKQLLLFDDVEKIYHFPAGYLYSDGFLGPWYKKKKLLRSQKTQISEDVFAKSLELAVEKRLRTNMDDPIYIFLSGGVDSATICKIANSYHKNVISIILGMDDMSLDYQTATKFCQEYGYRYKVIRPNFSYQNGEELNKLFSKIVWHTESYCPLVNMQGIANYFCSKTVAGLGGSIVLVGEGADEIFAGYNTFKRVYSENIHEKCFQLLDDMQYRQMRRVESIGMAFTLEIRQPFFDTELVELALSIPGGMKIKKFNDGEIETKRIMRRISEYLGLPEYVYSRKKLAFANGANIKVGNDYKKDDSDLVCLMRDYIKKYPIITKKEEAMFSLSSITEKYFFILYKQHGFMKLNMDEDIDPHGIFHQSISRTGIVKDTLADW